MVPCEASLIEGVEQSLCHLCYGEYKRAAESMQFNTHFKTKIPFALRTLVSTCMVLHDAGINSTAA